MQLAEPSKVAKLKVKNDNDVCDGSSYHIALYDSNDERAVYKGGYMPIGKKFWETYDAREIAPYMQAADNQLRLLLADAATEEVAEETTEEA